MKISSFKSAILCFGVVPLLLLAMFIVEQIGGRSLLVSPNKQLVIGNIDMAGDPAGSGLVPQSGALSVRGWAADTASGAPVRSVTVYLDGKALGKATLGSARPDVVRVYARSDYADSGWEFRMPGDSLAVGQHTVTVRVVGPSGTVQLESSKSIAIAQTGGGPK